MRTLRIGEGVPGVQGSGDCEDDMAAGAGAGAGTRVLALRERCCQWADSNTARRGDARLLPQHTTGRWWTGPRISLWAELAD